MSRGPLRLVERVETWKSRSVRGCFGYHEFERVRLWLSCGHYVERLGSRDVPRRARCKHPACIRETSTKAGGRKQ